MISACIARRPTQLADGAATLIAFGVPAQLRSAAFACGLTGLLGLGPSGCWQRQADSTGPVRRVDSRKQDDARKTDGDPRVDPVRCSGDGIELTRLVGTGLCTIAVADAIALPGPEQLEIITPSRLVVVPGDRLEFELILRNRGAEPLDVDLRLRQFLPLGPETTVRIDGEPGPDPSCTLSPMSTDPPPERISLPPDGELAVPCEWYANTRLVDPRSYVGSECPDFPALAAGRYRSRFRINGGAGTLRDVAVEIEVRGRKR